MQQTAQPTATTQDLNNFNQTMVKPTPQPGTFSGATSVNFLNTPSNSPTIVSNANIGKKIQENNQTFQQLSQPYKTVHVQNYQDNPDGTTTNYLDDGTTSRVRYNQNPDGSLQPYEVEDTDIATPLTKSYDTPESAAILKGINDLQSKQDDISKQYLDRIKETYRMAQEDQRITNSRVENSVRGMLAMQGSNASGSDANSLLNETIKEGQRSLNKLTFEEQGAYLEALKAKNEGDERLFDKKVAELQTIRNAKIEDIKKYNEKVQEHAQKLQEERIQAQKENAVANLVSQGTTDPLKISQSLKAQGISVPLKTITDTTALLTGIGGTGIIGEYNFYKSQALQAGQTPVDFQTYQDLDANRKKVPTDSGAPTSYKEWELAGKPGTYAQWLKDSNIKAPTQAQQTVAEYAARIEQSNPLIENLEKSITTMSYPSFVTQTNLPSAFQSSDIQQYMQASRNFINAKLRRESGATIRQEEFDDAKAQYLPVPGDKPEVLAQKKANRDLVYKALRSAAGNAYQSVDELMGTTGDQLIKTAEQNKTDLKTIFSTNKETTTKNYNELEKRLGHEPSADEYFEYNPEDRPQGNQSFNQVVGDTNPAKGIVSGVNISSYATDPKHEVKIASIVEKIPDPNTFNYDLYIKSIAPQSKITGDMIKTASSTYGVDPRLVLAIIQNDSSFGTKGHGAKNNNPGNIGQFDNLKGTVKGYPTLAAGVEAVAQWLAKHKTTA